MKRVLTELPQECELTAQMYISGLEKKEIASLKYKAVSTIDNQLQEAFQKLNVKNGRELCRKFYERLSGIEFTFDFSSSQAGSSIGSFFSGIGDTVSGWWGSFTSWAGLATGGYISGPGTGTSDSIPAMLSNGEFVINAKAAKKFGPMLEAINSGSPLHFATGGLVRKFADGGALIS